MNNKTVLALFSIFIFLSHGCAAIPLKYAEPTEAQSFIIKAPAEKVFEKTKKLLEEAGCQLYEESFKDQYLAFDRTVDFLGNLKGTINNKEEINRFYLRYIFIIDGKSENKSVLYIRGLVGTRNSDAGADNYNILDYIRRTMIIWGENIQKMDSDENALSDF